MNFGLRVVGRRPDGYHELESLLLPLDLCDEVELRAERAGAARVELRVEGGGARVPAGAENLAARAAARFLAASGLGARVEIRLVKRIPAAAGLGGGSSDAGAVLRGLVESFPGALAPPALQALALELGADVPFFLAPRPTLVGGIGEQLAPLAGPWPALTLLLANPGEPLATARVFAAHRRAAHSPAGGLARQLEALDGRFSDAVALGALLANDLEPAATGLCPALAGLRAALEASGARAVGLSGSGATLFGVFEGPAEARAAGAQLAGGVWWRVARSAEAG